MHSRNSTEVTALPLGKLQFYWRMTRTPDAPPNPVPAFVDFEFAFLEDVQLIIQTRNVQTAGYLETIYREHYNVGYLQEGHALASSYGGDFISCVEQAIATHQPGARRISEIGAGGCYVLKRLAVRGFEVAAIDPSPVAVQQGHALGIEVIPEFYPASAAIPASDVIIHYDVLEHVADPAGFLAHHRHDLQPDGLVVIAVPDCSPYIERGDLSMVLHEHLNYFDADSLRNVVEAGGFHVLDIHPGGYGGVLYCIARVAPKTRWHPKSGSDKFTTWAARVERLRGSVDAFIADATEQGHTLGCYVPLRAAPYLALRGMTSGFRFFDDDPGCIAGLRRLRGAGREHGRSDRQARLASADSQFRVWRSHSREGSRRCWIGNADRVSE